MDITEERLQELETLGREALPFKAELQELCSVYRNSYADDLGKHINNQVNLCDCCTFQQPECPGNDIIWGNGEGNDNVAACAQFVPQSHGSDDPVKAELVEALEDLVRRCKLARGILQSGPARGFWGVLDTEGAKKALARAKG